MTEEICDLLSLDGAALKEINQYAQLQHTPQHVWLRLRGDLEGLLSEREGGRLKWYHRQLKETTERRYEGLKTRLSKVMASATWFKHTLVTTRCNPQLRINRCSYLITNQII
jgi:hypothetical protein